MPSLSVLLSADRVLELPVQESEQVIRTLVGVVARDSGVDADRMVEAVLERELLCTTGFGEGVAMPHIRHAGLKRFYAVLGRSSRGVEFSAVDGQPVHLFLLIAGPEAQRDRYQRLMSRAAKFLKGESSRLLQAAEFSTSVAEVLTDY